MYHPIYLMDSDPTLFEISAPKGDHLEPPTVNTKNLYRKGTDLWAEFGNKIPFGGKNLLRGFDKDACGRQYTIIRQKGYLRLLKEVFGNA
jgi:hypothetical protein